MAYQFVDALLSLGIPARIASPDGRAETWFDSQAPVVDRAEAIADTQSGPWVFSHPSDFAPLRELKEGLVFHCLGTDHLIDAFVSDPHLVVLTCWDQAFDYCLGHGANPIDVGIGISDCFFYRGDAKASGSVAWMPRRGMDVANQALEEARLLGSGHSRPIDGAHERQVAATLRESSVFIATAEGEYFGLPALEALAAGCIVLSVPVVGGLSYLEDAGVVISPPTQLGATLTRTLKQDLNHESARKRLRGITAAGSYTISGMRSRLKSSLTHHGWHT